MVQWPRRPVVINFRRWPRLSASYVASRLRVNAEISVCTAIARQLPTHLPTGAPKADSMRRGDAPVASLPQTRCAFRFASVGISGCLYALPEGQDVALHI